MTSEQVMHGLGRHSSQLNASERLTSLRVSATSLSAWSGFYADPVAPIDQDWNSIAKFEYLIIGLAGSFQVI
jgi:hypothetical protein